MKQFSTFMLFLCLGAGSILAQNTKTEVDLQEMQKEMQEKMERFQKEIESSMKLMQEQMQGMELKNLKEKNQIIINGDTIVIAGDDVLSGMNFNELFQQIPDNMQQFDFFFGGDSQGFDDIFKIMEDFSKGQTPSFQTPENETPKQPKKKKFRKGKDEKNRKIYSL